MSDVSSTAMKLFVDTGRYL